MSRDIFGSSGVGAEPGNATGNPLRSFRMSMLTHGFVDRPEESDFTVDESDAMSYSVVRVRGGRGYAGLLILAFVIIVAVVGAVVILT
jgi:hypothetical protein